ncbi:MAG: cytochrome c oxidase assembly protein [Alphaproteobacteria bacterium]|nr:cytochrome c oxidase assembly protein [Alphaproteobacteria bacterium]
MDNEDIHAEQSRKNARIGLSILAVVIGMVALSFAFVPLYNMFCRVTGFAGTTQVSESLPDTILDRQVTIKFNAETNKNLPWDFKPEQREITVKLGQRGLTAFSAHNKSNKVTGGTAIYNVTPLKAGQYFHKIQCFCFDEQFLKPQEYVDMPVMFYVDPAMDDDPLMEDVDTITLSYTFFTATSKELDSAMEAFYNDETVDLNSKTN